MFHVALHLPWDWRIGPSDTGERGHVLDMLGGLPKSCLLCGDAGFVGYDFAHSVLSGGRGLLVRVGANVTLLQQLGYVRESLHTVYVWPDKPAARHDPPLVFRHVVVQGPRHPVHLIVAVAPGQRLRDRQVADIYRARWGVEVFYRHFKQTFQRRKLRSHSAENALVEVQWSLIGLWSILLFATAELIRQQIPPDRLSAAGSLRAFREIARDYYHPADRRNTLRRRLRQSLIDTYQRTNKASRNYPRKKKPHLTKPPQLKPATPAQIQLARTIPPLQRNG